MNYELLVKTAPWTFCCEPRSLFWRFINFFCSRFYILFRFLSIILCNSRSKQAKLIFRVYFYMWCIKDLSSIYLSLVGELEGDRTLFETLVELVLETVLVCFFFVFSFVEADDNTL